jgi:geranylgeranylglycerol-phosphate geranylgeranyltransferase
MQNAFFNADDGISQTRAFLQLFRLPVALMAAIAGVATSYALNPLLPIHTYLLTAIVLVCMSSAACAINDYWDVDKDSIDHPERPLPSGQLSLEQAWWVAIVLFAGALMAAVPLGKTAIALVAVNIVLLWNYSHLLKYSGTLGNVVVATVIALLIFLGSVVAGKPFAMLYPIGFLFCYALARELVWDIHDVEGDRTQGIVTVANHWGNRIAFQMVWILMAVLVMSMPIALALLPMVHPIGFTFFTLIMLVTFGAVLVPYQQQSCDRSYENLIFWERIGLLFGVLGLLGTAPAT